MFYAKDASGSYTYASAECKGGIFYCPDCSVQVRLQCSKKGRYFFVHPKRCCKEGGEGAAHYFWKTYIMVKLASLDAKQEVVLNYNRRADILVDKTIIEIQFSVISRDDIHQRVLDYTKGGYNQYWIFKLPTRSRGVIRLSRMALYIWKETQIPLLYIDFQKRCLIHVHTLQFIHTTQALYMYEVISWENFIYVQRTMRKRSFYLLQQKWKIERMRQLNLFYTHQVRYKTEVAKALYYLSQKGYTIEDFGCGYTGNCLFTVAPFIWQIQLVYLCCMKRCTIEQCCEMMQPMMIVTDIEIIRTVVVQLLERFSVLPPDM